MYGPIFFGPPKPPRPGTSWVKPNETLSWIVIEAEDDRVVLEGPGHCKGRLYLDLKDFVKNYRRV